MNEGILVKDLGSTNGTFIGALRVHEVVVTVAGRAHRGAVEDSRRADGEAPGRRRLRRSLRAARGDVAEDAARLRRARARGEHAAVRPDPGRDRHRQGARRQGDPRRERSESASRSSSSTAGSIPPTLAESILFGHEKGSFTGATERRKGALAEADGGTLFFDELGELPIELQPKLLRALASGR
jgi:predicted ATP-dependent protease